MEQLPEHLGHKPVFAVEYEQFDGQYAGDTDCKYLSIGLAQYDPEAVSAKTMRHSGNRWTRQAEELPLHRVIDLTLFMAMALFNGDESFEVPAGTFENQRNDIDVELNENRTDAELSRFYTFLEEHADDLKSRFNALADVLDELRTAGKL